MWQAIQDFLGPVPAPVFVLMFVAGLALSVIATAPTKWVERGLDGIARWHEHRKPAPRPKSKC